MTYISDMKKLIFIDACMRAGSRTRRLATPIIAELGKRYSVEAVDLTKNIYPVADNYTLEDRNQGVVPEEHVDLAKRIAAADRIVIAAPFWDMSFPSALKVFFENMSLFGITFDSNEKECYGLCKAENFYGDMIKGVVDVDQELLALDAELHSDLEGLLLREGSQQEALWGINLYPEADEEDFLEFDSLINIRPRQGNRSRDVENEEIRERIRTIVNKYMA